MDDEEIYPQEGKVKSVKEWKEPESRKEVLGFQELTGFHWKFVPRYAEVATFLHEAAKQKLKTFAAA